MMNKMTYTQVGEVLIPDLKLEHPDTKPLGKYGRMRRAFLQENNPTLFSDLILTEQLFPHLQEIDQTANRRVEQLLKELICSVLKIEKSCCDRNKTCFGRSALHIITKSEKTFEILNNSG